MSRLNERMKALATHSPAPANTVAKVAALAQPPGVAARLPTIATAGRHSRLASPATNSIGGGLGMRRNNGG